MSKKTKENITQALARLEGFIADRNFYEALQIYDFVFKRYNSDGEPEKADDIAKAGALVFIENNEFTNATTLAIQLIESLETRSEITDGERAMIKEITDAMTEKIGDNAKPLVDLLKVAVRWSAGGDASGRGGDPALNAALGAAHARRGHLADACRHYCHAAPADMPAYAALLRRYLALGYASEADAFAARAVLHLLALRRPEAATALAAALQGDGWSLGQPVWHAAAFLAALCGLEGPLERYQTAFKLAQDRYDASLRRDPELCKYVHKIGRTYFNVTPPEGAEENDLFSNIMKMLAS
uniref:Uncharacterized protein n=1 Tax=Heterosigma akashiwo TaxID=2829 RepID=A0A6T5NX73_HETAK|mmetsp:Transcript_14618/g.20218  ORF Transcript_14618/g.20218 Transcript_14618/m.20218 type:complete len:299 (+) Transcript_14618:38-934(+)|eukprot:CAMPEP_0206389880 /NCGR_PEP_ID=MMETSP0294-20121207/18234_1 /ASSEMBLY_ACC=CAM_ASM_000327 /TAXON_ID=39354 /ORGANISM="Heterosigma akashiwo, Strain CCMP2393" /LENGTH=298 /DNA_ID=CAMNT_0053842067 /DNA_START=40 /DNA_END=936 /DNA_ORIENTATION=+